LGIEYPLLDRTRFPARTAGGICFIQSGIRIRDIVFLSSSSFKLSK
jgi:hypothetical protein